MKSQVPSSATRSAWQEDSREEMTFLEETDGED